MSELLRILIVDDSALVRRALREMLESDAGIRIVGEAANGLEALQLARELKPDLITMDVLMPVMDGVETTEQLMAYNPTPILVVTSALSRQDIDISFQMLGAGALEVVEKPDLTSAEAVQRARSELIRRVKALARVRVVTHLRGRRRSAALQNRIAADGNDDTVPPLQALAPAVEPLPVPLPQNTHPRSHPVRRLASHATVPYFRTTPEGTVPTGGAASVTTSPRTAANAHTFPLVVIGSSTGGPKVVRQILVGLPASFGAAVVVTQHIAQGFSAGMVEWLATDSVLPVALARENTPLLINRVLVAPDSFNLVIQPDRRVHLSDQPCLMRPSVDVTMRTAAEVFGARAVGVLLTGMGRDGALGMQAIFTAGGYTIAQDEASCTIYGMPRAAIELEVVNEILPPEEIIIALQRRVSNMVVSLS